MYHLFIYFERVKERLRGEGQNERETERIPSSAEPSEGLKLTNLQTARSRPGSKPRVRRLNKVSHLGGPTLNS